MTESQHIAIPTWDELPDDVRSLWRTRIDSLLPVQPLLSDLGSLRLTLEDFDARELSEKVGHDAVLGARLLAVANSARFGLSTPLTSIQRAMVHMGFNLVKTIIVGYLMETGFNNGGDIPDAHRQFVHGWTAGASVMAFRIGQEVELHDASTAGTIALLCRVGSLMLGTVDPKPGKAYRQMDCESARLSQEMVTWGIASPILSAELIKSWGLPAHVSEMCARSADPVLASCPPDPLDPYPRLLTVVASSLAIADIYLSSEGSQSVLTTLEETAGYSYLVDNLKAHNLFDAVKAVWHNSRLQRELASATE